MAEETEEMQQEEKSIWELVDELNKTDEEPDEQYEEEQEEQDEEVAKVTKIEKKLSAKMEDMQNKFEKNLLRERIDKFEAAADEIEKDFFRSVASDIKTLEDFDRSVAQVKKQANAMKETAEKYRKELEERAWGTGPVGTPTKRDTASEEEEAIMAKIRAGDLQATLEALVGDDVPWRNR
jgi:DNA repair exonuclease SbcCD ATPase subunit